MMTRQHTVEQRRVDNREVIRDETKEAEMIFKPATHKDLDALAKYFQSALRKKAPFVSVEGSALGGLTRAALLIRVSLDPKLKWKNGIFHNSRYSMFRLGATGELEQFSKRYDLPKMRKTTTKSLPDAVRRISAYLTRARKETK